MEAQSAAREAKRTQKRNPPRSPAARIRSDEPRTLEDRASRCLVTRREREEKNRYSIAAILKHNH
jgi:hypothetical protein